VLDRADICSQICEDLKRLRICLDTDVGGAVITEEALAGPDVESVLGWFDAQAPWSDLPVIVMATKQVGRRSPLAAKALERLGNVVVLERPLNAETLASAVRSSLRVRRRQYQTRTLLVERDQNERMLRELNESLERRVHERARDLEKTRDALELALDSAAMGSWDLDLVTNTSWRTPQHDRIFGYVEPLASWGREDFLNHVLQEDRPLVTAAFAKAATEGRLELECRITRFDRAIRWIVLKGRMRYDADGRGVRLAGVIMDTTEQRRTEDALHQAQKMEAIGQLTGGVAHDFNNLLTVIVGALDLVLSRSDQAERIQRLARTAMTAARRGEQLTQQLLAFSRRQMLRPQTVNANRLLLEFEGLARRAVGEAVTLAFDLDPAADPIRIDPAQFEAAILNLVVNARDAMPKGGSISISSRNVRRDTKSVAAYELPPGPYVLVTVTDTGTGIDPQTLARAFEPFFTTKEVGKGSGLGLSQVYGFVRSAGGDVTIDSEVGRGTSVQLFFPRSQEPLAEEAYPAASEMPLRPAFSGETVLLVEDDAAVLAMAAESLEELRYRVIVARNAREALAHVDGPERIDIMFSDVVMPGGMNGVQLAVEARRLRPGLKILLTSGYAGEPSSHNTIAEDLDVLIKPYRRDELAQRLRVVLDQR
jgi:signal transduction histidine kinase